MAAVTGLAVLSLPACGAVTSAAGIQPPPVAVTTDASLGTDQAKNILRRAFTAAQQSGGTDAAAETARKVAYADQALTAAQARTTLAAVAPVPGAGSPVISPAQPGLLAVTRGPGYPRAIVAQTVPAAGRLPVLHLLTSPNVVTPFRIRASATMLPSSTVKRFDPLGRGSALVGDDAKLAVTPSALLTAYAAGLPFTTKAPTDAPFISDSFSTQVRTNAAKQAADVAVQSAFTQAHKVVPGSIFAVQQAAGDALVFGVIERTDLFSIKPGQSLNAPKEFVALVPGKAKIIRKATMTTLEFVVFAVPASSGKAVLVAADDQLVAAAGS